MTLEKQWKIHRLLVRFGIVIPIFVLIGYTKFILVNEDLHRQIVYVSMIPLYLIWGYLFISSILDLIYDVRHRKDKIWF